MKLNPRGGGVVPALILEGLMPCAPWKPTVAIKIRVLEAYRVTHVRCPQLAIQSFVKALSDLHGVRFYSYHYKKVPNLPCRSHIVPIYANSSPSRTICTSIFADEQMSMS